MTEPLPLLTDEVKSALERGVLCWLATVSSDGVPNVSPKEIFASEGERHVLVAHIASPNSVRNIRVNPNVCLSVVDIFEQRGFKILGRARVIERGSPEYEARVEPLRRLAGERFPIRSIIAIEASRVERIVAPRYRLYPDTTPEAQVARAVETYNGVLERHARRLASED
jgi:uncharacterized protein